MKYYLVIDLEMCMVKGSAKKKMKGEKQEIIQIGAVMLDQKHRIIDEFSSFVKPEYGKVDEFIENLTGITQDVVDQAPILRSVLMKFADWIGERQATVLSWSDSDYHQLQNEMRVKKIKHHKIQDLLDGWVDFQRSFDQMLGLKNQYALEDAMNISRLQAMGRMHDGLCDAYNTARLFIKVHRQSAFSFELVPICEYAEQVQPLSFSMGELFTPELLAQINVVPEEELQETKTVEERQWSIWRRIYKFFKGQIAADDEHWNKLLFTTEMRKLDLVDILKSLFHKENFLDSAAA
ncbi:MAG: 3'-5' exonuclease [Schaedlerella sp.]|nr:3'-5' exonuclease [Schaedlerella sp.]